MFLALFGINQIMTLKSLQRAAAVVTMPKLCPLVYSQGLRRETMTIDLALNTTGERASLTATLLYIPTVGEKFQCFHQGLAI